MQVLTKYFKIKLVQYYEKNQKNYYPKSKCSNIYNLLTKMKFDQIPDLASSHSIFIVFAQIPDF